jgi:hypothetical protein
VVVPNAAGPGKAYTSATLPSGSSVQYKPFRDGVSIGLINSKGGGEGQQLLEWLVSKYGTVYSGTSKGERMSLPFLKMLKRAGEQGKIRYEQTDIPSDLNFAFPLTRTTASGKVKEVRGVQGMSTSRQYKITAPQATQQAPAAAQAATVKPIPANVAKLGKPGELERAVRRAQAVNEVYPDSRFQSEIDLMYAGSTDGAANTLRRFGDDVFHTWGIPDPALAASKAPAPQTWFDVGHGTSDSADAFIVSQGRVVSQPITRPGSDVVRPPTHQDLFDGDTLASAQATGRIDHSAKRISIRGDGSAMGDKRVAAAVDKLSKQYPDYEIYQFDRQGDDAARKLFSVADEAGNVARGVPQEGDDLVTAIGRMELPEHHSALWKELEGVLKQQKKGMPGLSFVDELTNAKAAGEYDFRNHLIRIKRGVEPGDYGRVLLHEAVHAATRDAVELSLKSRFYGMAKDIPQTTRDAYKRLESISDYINSLVIKGGDDPAIATLRASLMNKVDVYGFDTFNPQELLANVFTDPRIQEAMSQITVPRSSKFKSLHGKTLMQAFMEFVKDILGIKSKRAMNALEEVMGLGTQIMEGHIVQAASPAQAAGQLTQIPTRPMRAMIPPLATGAGLSLAKRLSPDYGREGTYE